MQLQPDDLSTLPLIVADALADACCKVTVLKCAYLSVTLIGKWITKVAGLTIGSGVFDNISDAYSYLMEYWRPGDRVFIFGFSRGASRKDLSESKQSMSKYWASTREFRGT